MEKKTYETPVIEVIELNQEDLIVMSGEINFKDWMKFGGEI